MFEFRNNSLALKILTGGDIVNDTTEFRFTLLDNLPLIRTREDNIEISISQAEADQFYGDFYGLLAYLNVPTELFWLTTQLNNLTCSTDYDSDKLDIKVPSKAEFDRIKTLYLSGNVN